MRSVSTMFKPKLSFVFFLIVASFYAGAQENSPFSRYGLGDPYPSQNIVNRALGCITSTFINGQSINFSNPASYSGIRFVTYDIGVTLDSRDLRSATPVRKYNSVNLSPSYVALGVPLSRKKNSMGLAFGLRPLTKVSYNIQEAKRLPADSIISVYEGDGGLYQGFIGIGKQWGRLRVGINSGLLFGRKESITRTIPIDTVLTYKSNSTVNTSYNSAFLNFGLHYSDTINKTSVISFGFAGNLKQKLNAKQTILRETFEYDFNGAPAPIDSVYNSGEISGTIELPASYSAGISLNKLGTTKGVRFEKAVFAVEYESASWSQFRSYNQSDRLINSWQMKFGTQYLPDPLGKYWNTVTYRAGFYFGKDAVNADGNTLPITAFTFGMGLPVRKFRSYDNQFTYINTTFEIGKRGNKSNNITESFFRFSVGLNLSDVWFIKRRYD
jgi:hypothetical protein